MKAEGRHEFSLIVEEKIHNLRNTNIENIQIEEPRGTFKEAIKALERRDFIVEREKTNHSRQTT